MTQRLDVHYQGITADGNRLRVTLYQADPPLQTEPYNIGTDEKPVWLDFVCGHTARHDSDDDDTDRCFPSDPKFDDPDEKKGFTRKYGMREELDDCPNDDDGDGDCALCVRRPEGCFHRGG